MNFFSLLLVALALALVNARESRLLQLKGDDVFTAWRGKGQPKAKGNRRELAPKRKEYQTDDNQDDDDTSEGRRQLAGPPGEKENLGLTSYKGKGKRRVLEDPTLNNDEVECDDTDVECQRKQKRGRRKLEDKNTKGYGYPGLGYYGREKSKGEGRRQLGWDTMWRGRDKGKKPSSGGNN